MHADPDRSAQGGPAQARIGARERHQTRAEGVKGGEHVEVLDHFEYLVGEGATQRCELAVGPCGQGAGEDSAENSGQQQADEEGEPGGRNDQPDADHAEQGGDARHQEGLHDAQRQVLQVIDIAHEAGEQVAAPGTREPGWGHRNDATKDSQPQFGELPERGIVAGQPFQVAKR